MKFDTGVPFSFLSRSLYSTCFAVRSLQPVSIAYKLNNMMMMIRPIWNNTLLDARAPARSLVCICCLYCTSEKSTNIAWNCDKLQQTYTHIHNNTTHSTHTVQCTVHSTRNTQMLIRSFARKNYIIDKWILIW